MALKGKKNAAAYEELKNLFVREEFEKEAIIPISDIAEKIDMGRAPVTEALKRLETEKYIIIIPQKGVMVREMTLQEMKELNDVRIALEGFSIRKAAELLTQEDLVKLQELMDEQQVALENRNPQKFRDLDEEFHIFLSKASGNSYIYNQVQHLRDKIFNIALRLLKIQGRMETTLCEHKKIVDALIKRDGNAASILMVEHLETGRKHIGML